MDLDLSFNNRVRLNYQPPNNGQQSAVNPRTAPAPNSALAPGNNPGHMSHHHIYQSADTGTQQRQQPAINPWSNPPSTQCHWSYTAHFTPGCVAYPLVYPVPLVAAPAAMHYPGQPHVQFYNSSPAAEPFNVSYQPHLANGQRPGGSINANVQGSPGPSKSNGPIQLVPQQPSPNQELWCRELDGNYTLRTVNTIMQELQPGYWKKSVSGFPYWIRTANA